MGKILFNNLKNLKLQQIKANPNQPRKYFEDKAIIELAESIKKCGLINPITVRKYDGYYQIIAGERRYRASRLAGLTEIPCLIMSNDENKASIMAIVENIQRYDLNFVEEGTAYIKLVHDFGYKQEDIAKEIGKTQSAVANKIRVLKLGEELLRKIIQNNLTERHARTLLRLPEEKRSKILDFIIENNLNVAKSEELVCRLLEVDNNSSVKTKEKKKKYAKICAEAKFFINSINKSVDAMNLAGFNAKINKKQTDNSVVYTIELPI